MRRVARQDVVAGTVLLASAVGTLVGAASPWLAWSWSMGCHLLPLFSPHGSSTGFGLLHAGPSVRFHLAFWLLVLGMAGLFFAGIVAVLRPALVRRVVAVTTGAVASVLVGASVLLATPPSTPPGFCLSYGAGRGLGICVAAAVGGLVGTVLLAWGPRRQADVRDGASVAAGAA